jgi:hypothetical protein
MFRFLQCVTEVGRRKVAELPFYRKAATWLRCITKRQRPSRAKDQIAWNDQTGQFR